MAENPPAFPRTGEGFGDPRYDTPGMTLRDWFAGQALAGFMTANSDVEYTPEALARCVFDIADAMLSLREKGGTRDCPDASGARLRQLPTVGTELLSRRSAVLAGNDLLCGRRDRPACVIHSEPPDNERRRRRGLHLLGVG